jgi:imidazole glycerol-phosphate synthase subunit HisF
MLNIRIIPRLDIKGPNLVKGIHLEGLRVLGKPEQFAKYYYEEGADELVYQDVVASLYDRNSLHEMITRTAKTIFIPLTVGGGLRSINDMRDVLRAGADKVSINTAALKNPEIIKEASRKFGSSTIVVAIEAIAQNDGQYLAYTDNGRNYTGVEVISWAQKVEELGAGEIFLTSVDKDGSGHGYDLDLVKKVANAVSIPVIAHGGPGKLTDISDAIEKGNADAVAIASMLHYDYIKTNRGLEGYESEGNITFLKSGQAFSQMETSNLKAIKDHLSSKGIDIRY